MGANANLGVSQNAIDQLPIQNIGQADGGDGKFNAAGQNVAGNEPQREEEDANSLQKPGLAVGQNTGREQQKEHGEPPSAGKPIEGNDSADQKIQSQEGDGGDASKSQNGDSLAEKHGGENNAANAERSGGGVAVA